MRYGYSYNRSSADAISYLISFALFLAIVIILAIVRTINHFKRHDREEKIRKYAEKKGFLWKPFFSQPIKDGEPHGFFRVFQEPSYSNVLEIKNETLCSLYLGELEFVHTTLPNTAYTHNGYRGRNQRVYDMGTDFKEKIKGFVSMCVIYDKGMSLPKFNILREGFKEKAKEYFNLQNTQDIDFSSDSLFSDTWWLSGDNQQLVRELFSANIRSGFKRFADKGYSIFGYKGMICIICDKLNLPDKYDAMINDMKAIQKLFQSNNKFYSKVRESEEPQQEEEAIPKDPPEFLV